MWPRCLVVLTIPLAGCARTPDVTPSYEAPARADTNFAALSTLLSDIPKSTNLSLYEGLPSEFWEPQSLETELSTKKTVRLRGHPFYEQQLEPSAAEVKRLGSLFSAKDSFSRFRPSKNCGGFHADYGVEWNTGSAKTIVLISLECGEVEIFGSEGSLHCDLRPAVQRQLKDLLANYRKNRPPAA